MGRHRVVRPRPTVRRIEQRPPAPALVLRPQPVPHPLGHGRAPKARGQSSAPNNRRSW